MRDPNKSLTKYVADGELVEIEDIFDTITNLRKCMLAEIINNQELLKLVYYMDTLPLEHDDLTIEEIWENVIDKIIYLNPKATDSLTEEQVLITSELIASVYDNYVDCGLFFKVICNKNILNINCGQDRAERICRCLNKIFNKSYSDFVGDMKLEKLSTLTVPINYKGLGIKYKFTDFNR